MIKISCSFALDHQFGFILSPFLRVNNNTMDILHRSYAPKDISIASRNPVLQRFLDWCKSQEENRLLWLAMILMLHGCILTPVTILFIVISGNSLLFWAMAIAAIAMSLVSNLAALPTKFTIPVFFLSLVIDFIILVTCIFNGLDFAAIQ
jgi:hypothetical protein